MANTGAHSVSLGDPIYAIEVTYGDGHTAVKTYPSRGGLGSGLAATRSDIKHFAGHLARATSSPGGAGWIPVSCRTLICQPDWKDYTP